MIPLAVQQALTAALQQVEELRGVRLYPLSVEALPHEAFKQQGESHSSGHKGHWVDRISVDPDYQASEQIVIGTSCHIDSAKAH